MSVVAFERAVTAQEWKVRCDLAACYRLVARYGWSDLLFTRISARVPGERGHFLINPCGKPFDDITASSLVLVDRFGQKVRPSPRLIDRAGCVVHGAVHAARADAGCVVHTLARRGSVRSVLSFGIRAISKDSTSLLNALPNRPLVNNTGLCEDEMSMLRDDFSNATYFMLRDHGLMTVGSSIAEAFSAMYLFEATSQVQVAAHASGQMLDLESYVAEGLIEDREGRNGVFGGALAWPGLLKLLDRTEPDYAT